MSSTGTTPPDLTKVQNQPSLTNYVELVRVDGICEYSPSKFEIVRWKNPPETLQHLFAAMSVFRGSYDLYYFSLTRLKQVSFDDLSERKATYFAIKNTITCRKNTSKFAATLFNIWTQRPAIICPVVMPSRILRLG